MTKSWNVTWKKMNSGVSRRNNGVRHLLISWEKECGGEPFWIMFMVCRSLLLPMNSFRSLWSSTVHVPFRLLCDCERGWPAPPKDVPACHCLTCRMSVTTAHWKQWRQVACSELALPAFFMQLLTEYSSGNLFIKPNPCCQVPLLL